jgi:hypothetical protein
MNSGEVEILGKGSQGIREGFDPGYSLCRAAPTAELLVRPSSPWIEFPVTRFVAVPDYKVIKHGIVKGPRPAPGLVPVPENLHATQLRGAVMNNNIFPAGFEEIKLKKQDDYQEGKKITCETFPPEQHLHSLCITNIILTLIVCFVV